MNDETSEIEGVVNELNAILEEPRVRLRNPDGSETEAGTAIRQARDLLARAEVLL